MLTATGIVKDYPGAPKVLDTIDLTVPEGQFLAIMGPSGSGKSTLLHVLSGMEPPTRGVVDLDGQDLTELPDKKLAALRLRRLGFVFQQPRLLAGLSLRDNVALPGLLARSEAREVIARRADDLLRAMGVAGVSDHRPSEVSGGQLQRASICRALINGARTIMGDEPTGALNRASAEQVLDLLGAVHREGRTLVIVTHDAQVAARADRVLALVDGRIAADLELGTRPEDYDESVRGERVCAVTEVMSAVGV
ncbi:ABC transporter ATP-binding protein [Actinomyces howellii]|uniref:Lipoprotein-releasing system ATP-binding protein LolD n=1 Tax=Actinomyces howellii TaxID=52771 RepID=A0A448HGV8_9ACTO|nr:ABC transporter ATP-binding protein [Actinomyces howellii]VEG28137.1 Lipoprotein-releasing system ATP-binding protein LolD [Actinomyces howellii]